MRRFYLPILLLAGAAARPLLAQTQPPAADSTRRVLLTEATVTGYGQQLPRRRTAASIGVVEASTLNSFGHSSLTQAVNTLPGVRLEERATASYRLSIRGSTLRSPFGVRNVKVYYHDIPFTEASGSTPLNLLDPAAIGRIEVLKGPAGSAYGAGTGGAVRFETPRPQPGGNRVQAGFTAGSFGLRRSTLAAETSGPGASIRAGYARQTLAGYRQNSALRRELLTLDAELQPSDQRTLSFHALYADLDYQLPGSLTRAQFEQDPRLARPDAGPGRPGTVRQQAAYASRSALLGLTHEYHFSDKLANTTTIYGSGTSIRTPFLVDFEHNTALGGGGRTVLRHTSRLAGQVLRLAAGGELQGSFESSRNYENLGGQAGLLRYDDDISTLTGFGFAQADLELPAGFLATVAASYNRLRYRLHRLAGSASPAYELERNFRPELSPRLALLKEITPAVSAYASVSRGFSPPTEEEIRPSDGSLNTALQAEQGTSYELGLHGRELGPRRLTFDLALFDFELRQTIVTRSNAQGTALFANSGATRQLGAEAAASIVLWQPVRPAPNPDNEPAPGLRAWASYAYNHFRFQDYQSATEDFSGNRLTGTAPHTLSAGLDGSLPLGFYLRPSLSHQAAIPLNDANTEYAAGYWVFSARGGWRHTLLQGRLEVEIFAGADNLSDQRYSLGNDLNAFGSRYFQPAPGRSVYGGISLNHGFARIRAD
jgi:iron complex outermembrane receptor protein